MRWFMHVYDPFSSRQDNFIVRTQFMYYSSSDRVAVPTPAPGTFYLFFLSWSLLSYFISCGYLHFKCTDFVCSFLLFLSHANLFFLIFFWLVFLGSFSTCRYFNRNIDHLKCIVHSIVQMLWPIPHSIPEFYFPLVGIQFSIVISFSLSLANLEFYSIA